MSILTLAATPARRAGRVSAALLLVSLLVTGARDGAASPSSQLHDAKGRLAALTQRIGEQEAQARTLGDRLAGLDARIDEARSRIAGIGAELTATRRQLRTATARIVRLQARLDVMARSLFMQGVGSVQASMLGQLLGSSSIADVGDLLTYGHVLGQSDVDLADQVGNLRVELSDRAAELDRLRTQQQQLMADLSAQRASAARAAADLRATLSDLDRTKERIVELIAHLHREIQAQAIATVGTAFQGAGHVSYGSWAGAFLRTVGAPGCRSNLVVLVAWQYSEFTQAAWNPLADTFPMPGSTDFNSFGVQNYVSFEQGVEAVRHTLTNGPTLGYPAIVSGLTSCSGAMTTANAIRASAWCRGCAGGAYVTGVVPKIEADYELYARL